MSSAHSIWPINNTVVLSLLGLVDSAGNFQNAATVELRSLTDTKGNDVSGISCPVALTHVALSNGNYQVQLSANIQLRRDQRYRGTVRAISNGIQFEAVEEILAQELHV